ncbi:hypothetical protein ACVWW5_005443 [Bradyrhizobium sp. LM3.4]
MRATGIADWITEIAVSTALCRVSKLHTAAEIACGTGCTFSVISVMIPSVPSAPTNIRVRS